MSDFERRLLDALAELIAIDWATAADILQIAIEHRQLCQGSQD
jgi:hypothetical protein